MSYIPKTISEVILEFVNRTTFLPAIQREYVWNTDSIEKLFDSVMGGYPISSFLFWKIREEKKNLWTSYKFFSDFDREAPHNDEANMAGVTQDIYLVLDGQQRLTSLFIGLKGSYRYFYYRWRKTRLYLNLFKAPVPSDNPDELTYEFAFRENAELNSHDEKPQYWYLVGDILDFAALRDARADLRKKLADEDPLLVDNAIVLIETLHSKLYTERLINFYEERSDDYNKVVEVFIRANTGGKKLEYSDILLSTATAKWRHLNARDEIHDFTDRLNGLGYQLGKDFVLKGSLYLTLGLPIAYKVENFTRPNLERIEDNWNDIKANLEATVRLVSRFGFSDKNLISANALLPIAFYLSRIGKPNFAESTKREDVQNQLLIQKWLTVVLLKNVFGSSTDTKLKNIQEVISEQSDISVFPQEAINQKIGIDAAFSDNEITHLLATQYGSKYSFLILALLYPDRDWKDNVYHEDHIYPKSAFTSRNLAALGISSDNVAGYQDHFNTIANLQLLSGTENLQKNATPFNEWLPTRDALFQARHSIPKLSAYGMDKFIEFIAARRIAISAKLRDVAV